MVLNLAMESNEDGESWVEEQWEKWYGRLDGWMCCLDYSAGVALSSGPQHGPYSLVQTKDFRALF